MYINQKIQVKWNNVLSKQYSISNGVKQGGCLSPTLFSIYLNDLIDVLRSSNIGCRYGNHYMGVYCYADDIGLLSPTLSGLKEIMHWNIKLLLMPLKVNFLISHQTQPECQKMLC